MASHCQTLLVTEATARRRAQIFVILAVEIEGKFAAPESRSLESPQGLIVERFIGARVRMRSNHRQGKKQYSLRQLFIWMVCFSFLAALLVWFVDFVQYARTPKLMRRYTAHGVALKNDGKYEEAIKYFNRTIRLDPFDAQLYYNRGNTWLAKDSYDRAIADYNEALRLDPNFTRVFNNRGIAWREKAQYDKAIEDYNALLRLQPKHGTALYNRGVAWHDQSFHHKAIADYTEAIQLQPYNATVYLSRGHAWYAKGEYGRAIEDYDEAIRLNSSDWMAYSSLSWILSTCPEAEYRDGDRAVKLARKSCELLDYETAACLDVLAAAYAEAGDFEQAVTWQEKAVRKASEIENIDFRRRLRLLLRLKLNGRKPGRFAQIK